MSGARHWEQDKDSTLYIGNLAEEATDEQVWELMLQCGPIVNVHLPKDRVSQIHQGYGFVEFASEEDADYACKIMNQIRVYGKPIRVNKASADKRVAADGTTTIAGTAGVGAELFVGNLNPDLDERVLYDTFSRFGTLVAPPKIARDDANLSKGYGFVSYAAFEFSDNAIANMHGAWLNNREVTVQYAYKKDGKGERHGDEAERALAAQARKHGVEVAVAAMPPALVMPPQAAAMPSPMGAPYGMGGPVRPPQGMPMAYGYGQSPVQNGNAYAPPRQFAQNPLQAPPPGANLPNRPPPTNAGYGGPMMPPGAQQGGYNAPPSMPPGMPAPPNGFRPPGAPPGYLPPS